MKIPERISNRVLNSMTVLIAMLALGLLVKQYLLPPPNAPLPEGPSVGSRVDLTGVHLPTNRRTLILAMQVGCHWCEESAGFYRDLIRSDTNGPVHLVAVLPQPIPQDEKFFNSLSLKFKDIRQVDFPRLKVYATPTLMLIGIDGRVEKIWMGMQSPNGEADVFKSLGLTRSSTSVQNSSGKQSTIQLTAPDLITAAQLIRLQNRSKTLPIIDVRPLQEFQKGHIFGSINIPQDEFESRVLHEVPKGITVVIYCHYCPPCESQMESEGVNTYCTTSEQWLHKLGYAQVKIVSDDFDDLKTAGVRIAGSSAEQFISGTTPVTE